MHSQTYQGSYLDLSLKNRYEELHIVFFSVYKRNIAWTYVDIREKRFNILEAYNTMKVKENKKILAIKSWVPQISKSLSKKNCI